MLKGIEGGLSDLSALHREIAAMIAPRVAAEAPSGPPRPERKSNPGPKLRESFRPSGTRTKARVVSRTVYANPIHWGWPAHNIEANRFGERAVKAMEGPIRAKYDSGIQSLIDRLDYP